MLKKKKSNNLLIMKKAINLLNDLQLIKDKKIKNFKNQNYKLKNYNSHILLNEAKLFCEWYVPDVLDKKKYKEFNLKFEKEVKFLLSKLNFKNRTFVHRDFHISNLMYQKKNIGLIDNQDAIIGNKAYDLASLIDDVRVRTSSQFKKKIFDYYLSKNKNIKAKKFKNDFDILSVLRNLKIIGIFTRLAIRDGKKNYLKLIPHAWSLINMRIHEARTFIDLKELLSQNFIGKIK